MLYEFARSVLDAQTPKAGSEALEARLSSVPPSNQQIINAAKKAYSEHQIAVDSIATALSNVINTRSETQAITKLDTLNWLDGGIGPSVVDSIYQCHDVNSALLAAHADQGLSSFSVGVFSNTIPGGNVGTIGFDRDLGGATTVGMTLTLDLYKNIVDVTVGSNLQLGVWVNPAAALHDPVIGLYIATKVQGLVMNLKMLLTPALAGYGFVVSAGANVELPVSSAVFAGTTATW